MKIAQNIVGGLLGLLFVVFGLLVLLKLVPMPPPPEGTPAAAFMAAFGPTGYMAFIKVLEIVGGILVAVPKTRNWGLLVLGPILVNIFAFHIFVMNGAAIADPVLILITLLTAFLLWSERRAFLDLLGKN
jgi:putative oxidoreductase